MLRFNVKIALRNIWKNKVFSSINILGLALSIACCLVISIYIWNEVHYDSFHKNYSRIYRVTEKQDQAGTIYNVAVTPGPLAPALEKDFPEIRQSVRIGNWSGVLKNGTKNVEANGVLMTENSFLSIFDFPLLKGNPKTALLSSHEIIISESLAIKYFGKKWRQNANILGQTFRLNGQDDFILAGIAKDVPVNSSIQFEVLLPISYLFKTDEWSNKWNSNNYHTYLLLNSDADAKALEGKLGDKLTVYNPETKDKMELQSLKDQYLKSAFDFQTDWGKRSNIRYIQIFSGVGLLLLIIACINFINLSTARSLKRSVEVGVRKVTGASRSQLILQFLVESVIVALISGVLAILIINAAQPFLYKLSGYSLNFQLSGLFFIGLFSIFIIIIGCIAGMYPAFVLSAFKPVSVIKNRNKAMSGRHFRQGLVIFQFAISVTLIICTFFMYQQLQFIQDKDLGFNKEQLISVRLGGALKGTSALFKEDLEKQSSIMAALRPPCRSLMSTIQLTWNGKECSLKKNF